MRGTGRRVCAGVAVAACVCIFSDSNPLRARQTTRATSPMTFFTTSVGRGFGGNLGGLAGADNHRQPLAEAVGHGSHTSPAYLSAPPTSYRPARPARDRIGNRPRAKPA